MAFRIFEIDLNAAEVRTAFVPHFLSFLRKARCDNFRTLKMLPLYTMPSAYGAACNQIISGLPPHVKIIIPMVL